MTSLFLRTGAANPNDVVLDTPTALALDAIAATGSGTLVAAPIKVGPIAAGLVGQGNLAVILIDVETLTAVMAGSGALAVSLIEIRTIAAAFTGTGTLAIALDTAPAIVHSSGGSRARGTPLLMSQLYKQRKPTRKRRIIQLDVIEAKSRAAVGMAVDLTSVQPLRLVLPSVVQRGMAVALENDALLNDEHMTAIALMTDLLAA